jgi:hypothetical protein
MAEESRSAAISTTVADDAVVVAPIDESEAAAADMPDETRPASTGGSVTPGARASRKRRVTVPAELDTASKVTAPVESADRHATYRFDELGPLWLKDAISLHPAGKPGTDDRPPNDTRTSRSPSDVPAGYGNSMGPDLIDVTEAELVANENLGPVTTGGSVMGWLGALGACDQVSAPPRTSTGCCVYR